MSEYSINTYLRKDKPIKRNGKIPVYLRIRIGNSDTKIPTGVEVLPAEWNDTKKEPKDNLLRIRINNRINEIDKYINQILVEDESELTIESVKNFCAGNRKGKPENASFFDYYEKFIERKRKCLDIKEGTIKCYVSALSVLKQYCKDIRMKELTLNFIENFNDYLIEERGDSPGGCATNHRQLRAVINDAIKHDVLIKNPYDLFPIAQGKTRSIYLTFDELDKMRKLRPTLNHNSNEYKILQMYLFACYTGLRFSDVIDLEWRHIDFEKNFIKKRMIKTRRVVITPLYTWARSVLLELSKGKTLFGCEEKVFKPFTNNAANLTIRKLAERVGLKKRISFHSSRHTFGTLLVQSGMHIQDVSKALGHSSIEMTMRYLQYDDSRASNLAQSINVFR